MNEAMTAYIAKLTADLEGYRRIKASLRSGDMKSFELSVSGNKIDQTEERIADYERMIKTLEDLIADIEAGKFG
ncbi:hypothetical protein N7379_23135 [Rhizobium pusense]|uniref:hypothetical protein n=1 Tax=Agrobacterium pusense TaxID=648995 RepID=UPI002447E75A|nr:hypothetical protein [Agrobacterium pusense]MDH0117386.1 hypothetical protein [Agrobacterium pusense]